MTPSPNETDRSIQGYAIVGIVLAPIVLLAFVNGIMAFVRVFTHTLGAIFLTLEIALVGLAIAAVGFWLRQRDRSVGYARMQATLEQLLTQENRSLLLVDFAAKVQLPVAIVRGFLDAAIEGGKGRSQMNDCGEIIYNFTSVSEKIKPIKTVDVEAISTEKIDSAADALFSSVEADEPQNIENQNHKVESQDSQIKNSHSSISEDAKAAPLEEVDRLFANSGKKPLIQAQLARRLSLSSSTLSYRKLKPNFSKWVQEKDPEGIAWEYSSDTKQFYPTEIKRNH